MEESHAVAPQDDHFAEGSMFSIKLLHKVTPGEEPEDAVAFVQLGEGGIPVFDVAEGEVLELPLASMIACQQRGTQMEFDPVSRPIPSYPGGVVVYESVMAKMHDGQEVEVTMTAVPHDKRVWADFNFRVYATNTRVVFVSEKADSRGQFKAGQLRYSWLIRVGSRPRQGMLDPCQFAFDVRMHSEEDWDVNWLRILVDLPKKYDPMPFAHQIKDRVARHCIAQSDFPEASRESMDAFLEEPPLALPAKGELAMYDVPISRASPGSTDWV